MVIDGRPVDVSRLTDDVDGDASPVTSFSSMAMAMARPDDYDNCCAGWPDDLVC